MLKNNGVLRFISLIAAVCLWVYVMGEVDPESRASIGDIPVTFTNVDVLAEEQLAVVQEDEIFISAVISGKRSDVNNVKKTGLAAYVDVSQCEKGRNTGKINISLPDGISLNNVSESTITFKVQKLMEEEKRVDIEFTDTEKDGETIPWVIETDPETVIISGAKSSVNRVIKVKGTIPEEKSDPEKSKWVITSLIPVDAEGDPVHGITLSADDAKAKIQLLTVKTVDLEVAAENVENGYEVGKIDCSDRISIVGPADALKDLEQLQGTIDLSGMTNGGNAQIYLKLPEKIYLMNTNEQPFAVVTMRETE